MDKGTFFGLITDYQSLLILISALLLDLIFAEPKKGHPLVFFGHFVQKIEHWFHPGFTSPKLKQKTLGVIALIITIFPWALLTYLLTTSSDTLRIITEITLLYLAVGHMSLMQHAKRVYLALLDNDLQNAKQQVALIVSRDTANMNASQVTSATIESVLENGNDAIFGAIFWYLIAGAPGVIVYRLSNTLDAMWGYRSERYLHFGWFAAKLDDLMNWFPARLSALTYAILGATLGNTKVAMESWWHQSRQWESSNAGSVMSSGAGALGIILGGTAQYQGCEKLRPTLGAGIPPNTNDIKRAMYLIQWAIVVWVIILFAGQVLIN